MKELKIAETRDTPFVRFSLEDKYCIIEGKSFPGDVSKFYTPLGSWVDKLKYADFETISFNIKLEYYNTASSKMILNLLYLFEEVAETGKNVSINWYYPEDDDDMLDAGEEFERLVNLPFRHISYEPEY